MNIKDTFYLKQFNIKSVHFKSLFIAGNNITNYFKLLTELNTKPLIFKSMVK